MTRNDRDRRVQGRALNGPALDGRVLGDRAFAIELTRIVIALTPVALGRRPSVSPVSPLLRKSGRGAWESHGRRGSRAGGDRRGTRAGADRPAARRPVLLGAVVCLLGMLGAMAAVRLACDYVLSVAPFVGGLLVVIAVWRGGAGRSG